MKLAQRPLIVFSFLIALLILSTLPLLADWTPLSGVRISIVWPHDGAGHSTTVSQSRAANVSVWPTDKVGCFDNPGIQLLVSQNNDPSNRVPITGVTITRTISGRKFPSVEFNDVPANLAVDPTAKFRFVSYGPTTSTSQRFIGNVWVHAADPRTYYPNPITPTGFSTSTLPAAGMDARIQIVWPHNAFGTFTPVEYATRVNIGVEVFEHGTRNAVPADSSQKFQYTLSLLVATWNNPVGPATYSSLVPVQYTVNGQTFTRWNFNDIPVVPWTQYHFIAGVTPTGSTNMSPYASVWTHAPDARTYLPNPVAPPACVP
ncbi:MAG: hypothetical protein HZB51_16920 [Chloroflexi bacterium]|nr:hypothetical protein [Chloroflexota bacterium]